MNGPSSDWTPVCAVRDLIAGRGVAALVESTEVAVFSLHDGTLAAIDNVDPFCGVGVLSRGIVGDAGGVAKVASPMYKQAFCLRTGVCLENPVVRVRVHDVRCTDGVVNVRLRDLNVPVSETVDSA
jgi:nitrite reductase (NADH) small subunit